MMVTVDLDTLEQMMRKVLADFAAEKPARVAVTTTSASYAARAAVADEILRRKLEKIARKSA